MKSIKLLVLCEVLKELAIQKSSFGITDYNKLVDISEGEFEKNELEKKTAIFLEIEGRFGRRIKLAAYVDLVGSELKYVFKVI